MQYVECTTLVEFFFKKKFDSFIFLHKPFAMYTIFDEKEGDYIKVEEPDHSLTRALYQRKRNLYSINPSNAWQISITGISRWA